MTTPYPFTPWYVPGWTAQQPYPGIDDVVVVGENQLPSGILTVRVTGNYVRVSGWAAGGVVKFSLLDTSVDRFSSTVILPDTIVGRITLGALSVDLPSGFNYKVREIVPGGRTFTVTVPADITGTIDINELLAPFVE
jgi:hypothetical protein